MRKYLEAFTNNWALLKFINKAITFYDCFRKIQSKHITWIYIHTLADKVNLVYLEFVGQLSQLTFYKIDLVTDLHPSVFPIPNQVQEKSEKHYLQFLCTKKKKFRNYDARDWLFFISYMMNTW